MPTIIYLLILFALLFIYSNVYVRLCIKNPKTARSLFWQKMFVGVFNPVVLFPLTIVGDQKEQMLRRRANFFLALFWICFAAIFLVMDVESY
jgi:Mn2+/Fe2+ NRAMP family transporter